MAPDTKTAFWDLINKLAYGVIVALAVWVWQTNERVVVLETNQASHIKGATQSIAKIETKVDRIYDLLLEDARNHP